MKNSRRRNIIIQAFTAAEGHLTVDELFERAQKIDPKIGYTTVWRTLKMLEDGGVAAARKFHDGLTRYEYQPKEGHHDHMICTKCGHVEEFCSPGIEKLQKRLSSSHGFEMTSHKMELYGYCKKCRK